MSDKKTLIQLAEEVGLERETVENVLDSCKFRNKVNEDIDLAKQLGVQGVPFFVFNENMPCPVHSPKQLLHRYLKRYGKKNRKRLFCNH